MPGSSLVTVPPPLPTFVTDSVASAEAVEVVLSR
jgi:hypothetical protein